MNQWMDSTRITGREKDLRSREDGMFPFLSFDSSPPVMEHVHGTHFLFSHPTELLRHSCHSSRRAICKSSLSLSLTLISSLSLTGISTTLLSSTTTTAPSSRRWSGSTEIVHSVVDHSSSEYGRTDRLDNRSKHLRLLLLISTGSFFSRITSRLLLLLRLTGNESSSSCSGLRSSIVISL